MNLITKPSGETNLEISAQKTGADIHPENDAAEVAQLAASIEANRASIKRNWEELARLDQMLLTLNARERGTVPRRSSHSKLQEPASR